MHQNRSHCHCLSHPCPLWTVNKKLPSLSLSIRLTQRPRFSSTTSCLFPSVAVEARLTHTFTLFSSSYLLWITLIDFRSVKKVTWLSEDLFLKRFYLNEYSPQLILADNNIPVLEIGFGPPTADFGSIWSSQKARKFWHFQKKKIDKDQNAPTFCS